MLHSLEQEVQYVAYIFVLFHIFVFKNFLKDLYYYVLKKKVIILQKGLYFILLHSLIVTTIIIT